MNQYSEIKFKHVTHYNHTHDEEGPVIPTEKLSFDTKHLAYVPDGMEPDNLLLASSIGNDIMVKLPYPEASIPGMGDTVQLSLDNKEIGELYELDDYEGNESLELTIPAGALVGKEGTLKLSYYLFYGISDHGVYGPATEFIVDITPPADNYFLAAPTFPFDILEEGVTPEKLTDIDGKQYLKGLISGYQGMAPGDQIIPYIENEPLDAISVKISEVDKSVHVNYPRELFEKVGDGEKTITYRVTDRAGNQSELSKATKLAIVLSGALENLKAPIIPLFDDDNLINDSDARVPVAVQIPGHEKILEGDKIRLHWGERVQPDISVYSDDVGENPIFEINVPYLDIFSGWDKQNNTTTKVWYQIFRGRILAGTSPEKAVIVNLDIAGGPDPYPETPVNENLVAPSVRSASGKIDVIDIDDSTKDATYIIPWNDAADPQKPVFRAEDSIYAFFGKQPLTAYKVTQQDIENAKDIELVLPKDAIDKEGTGLIPATYQIKRTVSGTTESTSLSPEKKVDVKSAGQLPGGGTLKAGRYTEVNGKGNISLAQAIGGVPFEIPKYLHKSIDDEIIVTFMVALIKDKNFTNPIETVVVTKYVSTNDVNSVTLITDVVTEAALKSTLQHGVPAGVGRCRTVYVIKNSSGSVTSDPGDTLIDIRA
ncbi:hypothetical protein ACGVWS_04305 [Enterobacteriaceae bacterium LUAb1]